ncbi:MAG: cytochrome c biogenesis protein CcsA [Lewinellaceae bacterium]|nr:cytochrome c biogenesis protein CcsA [Lewinellaceae bacterium]
MEYIGEHLLPGQIGHLFAVLSFVAALMSAFAFYLATQRRNTAGAEGWRNLGRLGYVLHGLAVLGIIGSLFYILAGKMYEYQYAWANVSDDLPIQYVFSAFWKEQQGSFLLWSFWHIVLGLVLILRGGKWETPVLSVMALAEALIASMILGLYFGDFRLGASPFDLLRDTMNAPIFAQADYLNLVKGNGLNPLLQNYWMTIHPPTLFLGFASTIVPFGFAIAGLWLREHREWLQPALKWALFSGAILGTGILMGGAWAYEALSFAGYWAWDPVENTSLVPWLIMIAGIHTNLVARSTGYSIRSTYGFYLLSFVLILYSTYLTRSGILGDTSAHAFTEMGLSVQLILLIAVFAVLGLAMWIKRYREIPDVKGEESTTAREFWMFIGSLVLLFSSALITGATSLPVVNKLFGTDLTLTDPVEHHNRYQLWIAVFIGLLTAVGQFMRYSERNWKGLYAKTFLKHMAIAGIGAAVLTVLNAQWIEVRAWQLFALLFSGMFAVVANTDYLISVLKGNLKLGASAVSHFGFGVLILGVLSTGLGKSWISSNSFAMEGLIEGMGNEGVNKNVLLMKEAPMPIRGYEATYLRDTIVRQTRSFVVQFRKLDANGNPTGESFTLLPNVMYDRQFSNVVANNPSTKHYWSHDIFTLVPALPKAESDPEYAKQQEDSLRYESYSAVVGDTIFTKKHYIVVENLSKQPAHPDYHAEAGDLAFGLNLKVYSLDSVRPYAAEPMFYLRMGKGAFTLPAVINPLQMKIRLSEASMEQIFRLENDLKYTSFPVKKDTEFKYKGYTIRFLGPETKVEHPGYEPEEGDIVVGARLEVLAPDGQTTQAMPVYLIRGNQAMSLKDEIPEMRLHFRFENIDPQAGVITLAVAQADEDMSRIPLEVAENVSRSDYIVLEAIVFPGINFVWLGSIMMMLGLALGLWRRLTGRQA